MKTKLNLLYFFIIANFLTVGQVVGQVVIGSDVDSGDPSAVLHLKSGATVNEAGGFILPKLDGLYTDSWLDSKDAVRSIYDGLLVQNVATNFTSIYKFEASLTPKWQVIDPWDVIAVTVGTKTHLKYSFEASRMVPPGVTLDSDEKVVELNESKLNADRILESTMGVTPIGGIIMWSGSVTKLPRGWVLCDNSTYTDIGGNTKAKSPDLRGRFIVGYDSRNTDYNNNNGSKTGGIDKITLEEKNIPSHNHGGNTGNGGTHTHGITDNGHSHNVGYITRAVDRGSGTRHHPRNSVDATDQYSTSNVPTGIKINNAGSHQHTINSYGGNSSGITEEFDNRPKYYTLAFIMYTGVDQNP